jgi:ketosteroid isomerase-like protein
MTTEVLDRVMRGYEAFNRGDLDSAIEGFDPDIEWLGPDMLPEDQVYRGPDGVKRFWDSWRDVFDDFRIEIDEMIEAGDHVIVMARVAGRGKDSGAEVTTPSFAHVWTIRDELMVRMEMLPSKKDAFAAVGIEQEQTR